MTDSGVPYAGLNELAGAQMRPQYLDQTSEVRSLISENVFASNQFEWNCQSQGIIGKTFDYLKNHVGTSSENHHWYEPAALWSNILDYNSGSGAIKKQIDSEGQSLQELARAFEEKNSEKATLLESALTIDQRGIRQVKSFQYAQDYDHSQNNGVETLTDLAALAASAAVPAGITIPMVVGGLAKVVSKRLDGKYSSTWDQLSGFATGAAPGLSRLAGAAVSTLSSEALEFAGVASRPLTLAANAASYGVESGTISAIVSANRQWWHSIGQGKTIGESLSNSASAGLSGFGSGFAAGIVVGAPLQMLKTSGESVGVEATLTNPSSLAKDLDRAYANAMSAGSAKDQTLLKEINGLLEKRELPPISSVDLISAPNPLKMGGGYSFYRPAIRVTNLNNLNYREILSHELKHHEQNFLLTMRFADKLGIGRDINGADAQSIVASMASKSGKLSQSSEAIDTFLQYRARRPELNLSQAETSRSERIINAAIDYPKIPSWAQINPIFIYKYKTNALEQEAFAVGRATKAVTDYVTKGTSVLGFATAELLNK